MAPSKDQIDLAIQAAAEKINAPKYLLPNDLREGRRIDIFEDGSLCVVDTERGKEIDRQFAIDINDLLYRIFEPVTLYMAEGFEAKHRIETQDRRRQIFSKQRELLGIINKEWDVRVQQDQEWKLRVLPFTD